MTYAYCQKLQMHTVNNHMYMLPAITSQCVLWLEAFAENTHQGHPLDRIYASFPLPKNFYLVPSTIKTKHSAVFATSNVAPPSVKSADDTKRSFRLRTPDVKAKIQSSLLEIDWTSVLQQVTISESFELFYSNLTAIINQCAPIRSVSLGKRAPK